jgi:hypothetical protein
MDFVHWNAPGQGDDSMKASHDASKPQHGMHQGDVSSDGTFRSGSETSTTMAADGQEEVEVTSRPRLTRDQAELLERHFQQYYKPTSNMKKELATATGLSLQRIAVRISSAAVESLLTCK